MSTQSAVLEKKEEIAIEKRPQSLMRVRFQDCDPFGHLNNGRYLDYMINAREEHLRDHYELDLYSERFSERSWVVRSSRITHVMPALPNQEIRVRTALLHHTRSVLLMEAVLSDAGDDTLLAVGWAEFCYIQMDTGRPTRHEPELMELFGKISLGIELPQVSEKERLGVIRRELGG